MNELSNLNITDLDFVQNIPIFSFTLAENYVIGHGLSEK